MNNEERIREIDHQMTALREERRSLEKAVMEEQQKKLQAAVGLCFRLENGDYVKIIGVPQEKLYKAGRNFNEYQLPVLKIGAKKQYSIERYEEDIRIEEDTLFSRAAHSKDVVSCLKREYQSVTPEEFNAALEKEFDAIRSLGTETV